MGSGCWTRDMFSSYTSTTKGVTMDTFENTTYTAQNLYKARRLSAVLNPKNIMRECRDSEEHPNTLPVILALDVTGSMGDSSVRVAQKLNQIMTDLYADENVKDIEFCIMGIGDLYYDDAPIQMSQFESDIRIAEQLDELYFEGGGGGNSYESYTAAWYMGVNHCDLDCWKRGRKGIIITLGDELPNPYLSKDGRNCGLEDATGDRLQASVDTETLHAEAVEKFDLYHISINDNSSSYAWNNKFGKVDNAWEKLLGKDHYFIAGLDNLAQTIVSIIANREETNMDDKAEIVW